MIIIRSFLYKSFFIKSYRISIMTYYEKYCKYKAKYLTLKKQCGGVGDANDNIIAIGDLHGDIELLLRILTTDVNENGSILVPNRDKSYIHTPENLTKPIHEVENYDDMLGYAWNPMFTNHTIIFTGDIIDGKRSNQSLGIFKNAEIKMLRLINRLIIESQRYNCSVIKILGNHEINALLTVQNDDYQFAFMDDVYVREGTIVNRKQYFRSKLTFGIDSNMPQNNLSSLIIDNAKIIYEINNHIFSHAGFSNDPAIPINGMTKLLHEILDIRRIDLINNFVINTLRGDYNVPINFILPNNEEIIELDRYTILLMIIGIEQTENLYIQPPNIRPSTRIPGLTVSHNMNNTHCSSNTQTLLVNRIDDDFMYGVNNILDVVDTLYMIETLKKIQNPNQLVNIPEVIEKIRNMLVFLRDDETLMLKLAIKNNLLRFKKLIDDLRGLFNFDAGPNTDMSKEVELVWILGFFSINGLALNDKIQNITKIVIQFKGLGIGYVKNLLNIIKNRSSVGIDDKTKIQQIINKYRDNMHSREEISIDELIRLLPSRDDIDNEFMNIYRSIDDEITKLNIEFAKLFDEEICTFFRPLNEIKRAMLLNKEITPTNKNYLSSIYEKIRRIYIITTQKHPIENEIIYLITKVSTFKNPFVSHIFIHDDYVNKRFVIGHLPVANIKIKYRNIAKVFGSYKENADKIIGLIDDIDADKSIINYGLDEYKNLLKRKIIIPIPVFSPNLSDGITGECDKLYKIDCGLSKAFGKLPNVKQQFLHIKCRLNGVPLDHMAHTFIDIRRNIAL